MTVMTAAIDETVWTDKIMLTDNTVETDKNFDTNDTTNIVTTMKTDYTLYYIANIRLVIDIVVYLLQDS